MSLAHLCDTISLVRLSEIVIFSTTWGVIQLNNMEQELNHPETQEYQVYSTRWTLEHSLSFEAGRLQPFRE